MIAEVRHIKSKLDSRGLGLTLIDLRKLCTDNHLTQALSEVEAIDNDYTLIKQFYVNGFDDPQRESLYHKLMVRTYRVIQSMIVDCTAGVNPTFKQSQINALRTPIEYVTVENALSQYDQELTMATLDDTDGSRRRDINQRLFRYRIMLFDTIFTSKPLSKADGEALEKVLLSPFVDTIDKQIILGALLLAQRSVFDIEKFRLLCAVCGETDDIMVRERALTAVALGLGDEIDRWIGEDTIKDAFDTLMAKKGMSKEFAELQTQILLSMDTSDNNRKINEDIMPTLIRNSQKMVDMEKRSESPLDDILHPDKEEKAMEDVEACVEKMRKMRDKGADIFFSGFSQAKRFGFFYTLMNWFCPFYLDHPQVQSANDEKMPRSFIDKLVIGQQFCNSDKYSFILSLASVIHQIPKEMLDMMQKGEVAPAFEEDGNDNPVFVRRSYLQDLYRFYNLYTDKNNFDNPFSSAKKACFFLDPLFVDSYKGSKYALSICKQFFRRNMDDVSGKLISHFGDDNVEYLKMWALGYERTGNIVLAQQYYKQAIEKEPENKQLLCRAASFSFNNSFYDESIDYVNRFLALATDDDNTAIAEFQKGCCLMMVDDLEEAQKIFYRLSYEHPEVPGYKLTIAKVLICQKKFDQAISTYESVSDGYYQAIDFVCRGIALWFAGHNSEAAKMLSRYIAKANKNDENILDAVVDMLIRFKLYKGNETNAMIMIDLAIEEYGRSGSARD